MKSKLSQKTSKNLISLKKKGYSLSEIANKLNIPKTTVFYHTKNVSIEEKYFDLWRSKRGGSKKRKILAEADAQRKANKEIDSLSEKEIIIILSSLYWAEGSKADFSFSNTDHEMVKVFIEILRRYFKINDDRIKVSLRIYEDLDKNSCLTFWSNVTNIPKDRFFNVDILSGKKVGKLKFGMCRVRVTKGGTILKQIKAVNKIIYEKMSS